ncbi:response regulator [Altericista sp. CCNU0014]|uniref:response regulator n=1 Tax=Altericista sp. CCNU0014 TaxID=3082949 RepID=UPI003850D74D
MLTQDLASILIVEDELIVAESLALDLQRKGYTIAGIVSSGHEAINAVLRRPPDIILMDIMLKGALDGIETSKVIQQKQSVPVIYITAFSDRATIERAQQAGETLHYLVKPIRLKDLVKTIEAVLESEGLSKATSQPAEATSQPTEDHSGFPPPPTMTDGRIKYDEIDLSFFDMD